MFATFWNKLKDVGTVSTLCREAERVARSYANEVPGSEHFVLAALAMQDGTARRALASLGATPEAFAEAIRTQFAEALRHAGLEMPPDAELEPPASHRAASPSKLYHAAPSGQSLVQRLAATAEGRKARALLSADVLIVAAEEELSIAARALRVLRITPQQLVQAAGREIALLESGQGGA